MKLSEYFKYDHQETDSSEFKTKKILKTLYKGVKIPWLLIILGAFLAVFNSIVILTQYDNYIAIFTGTMSDLSPLVAYLTASFIQYLLIFASVISDIALVKIVTGIRKKMWRKIMHLPLTDYDESQNGMLSRITSDAEYGAKPFVVVMSIFQIIVYFMSMSAAAPKDLPQALIFLIVTLVLAIVSLVFSVRICAKAVTYLQDRISVQTVHYSEQLANIRFIKASNGEEKAIARSKELIGLRYKASLYNAFATGLQTLSNNFTYIIIYSCAFLGGISAIKAHAISDMTPINAVYAFGIALELALVAVLTIPSYFASAVGGSRKLATVFKMEEEDTETGRALSEAKGDIVLKDSSFSYGDHEALNDISVVIPYGKITAIIGPNGSGKSTLAKLIDRLYPANNGDILLGDENATDVSLKSWRQQFGIVSQSPSLFSGSIRDNICYGLEREVSQEELDRVVQLSGLEDIIAAHPEGLDYEIGLKGNRLSGGEQQRVAIARALLKNPQYLILDEATANLDVRTEAEVSDGLRELMKDRTVIIIAHDYQVVRDADQFIIMKEGTIETVGTLQEVSGNDYFRQFIKADIA